MDEMIGYIFSGLKNAELATKRFGKAMKQQRFINKGFVMLSVAYIAYVVISEKQRKDEIDTLTKEIEELKRMKGE